MFNQNEAKPVVAESAAKTAEVTAQTPEDIKKAKKNEASKKMIERKKKAIATLVDLAKRLGSDEDKAAAAYLSGEGRVKGEKTAAVKDWVKELFPNGAKTVSETDIFKNTHMGRNEMRALCKKLSAKAVFINFDAEKGIYSVTDEAGYTGPKVLAKKI